MTVLCKAQQTSHACIRLPWYAKARSGERATLHKQQTATGSAGGSMAASRHALVGVVGSLVDTERQLLELEATGSRSAIHGAGHATKAYVPGQATTHRALP